MSAILDTYKGPWSEAEAVHLLKRTMFGTTKTDAEHCLKAGLEATVAELLQPDDALPFLPVNNYDEFGTNVPFGKTWAGLPYNFDEDGKRTESFQAWSTGLFINQKRNIREKLTLFWHNHFACDNTLLRSELIWQHHQLLRDNACGNFKMLLKKVTTDPQMLRFLNGEYNTNKAPNENYARELQELFCIGKDNGQQYTEEDVKQAAKVLTGWKADLATGRSYFNETLHDTGDKRFSVFYKNTVIKGRTGADAGEKELDELLNMLLDTNSAALFICRKFYRWFVNSEITQATEKDVIIPLAAIFRKNNYEIKSLLEALFTSEHFFDAANRGAQIKNPIDFCIGMQREFGVKSLPPERYNINYSMWNFVNGCCFDMGMQYGFTPNVAGWPAYYQSPAYYQLWLNSAVYPKRNEFATTILQAGYNREGYFFKADVLSFAAALKKPEDPDALINESLSLLYSVPVDDAAKKNLKKNVLLSGQDSDHYWTDAWNDFIKEPRNETKKSIVERRLKELYSFIISSAEYQLM